MFYKTYSQPHLTTHKNCYFFISINSLFEKAIYDIPLQKNYGLSLTYK